MKLFILSLTFITLINFKTFAQCPSPTTIEEYNYVVKGYRIQSESGLDMKKGYTFKHIFDDNVGNYRFTIKGLIRENKNELAATLVIVHSKIFNNTYYLCIPQGDEKLVQRYLTDLTLWDRPLSLAYAQLMSTMYGALSANVYSQTRNR